MSALVGAMKVIDYNNARWKPEISVLDTILLLQTDAHNYKIIGILKQLKFRLSLRHVSIHAETIFRELFRA